MTKKLNEAGDRKGAIAGEIATFIMRKPSRVTPSDLQGHFRLTLTAAQACLTKTRTILANQGEAGYSKATALIQGVVKKSNAFESTGTPQLSVVQGLTEARNARRKKAEPKVEKTEPEDDADEAIYAGRRKKKPGLRAKTRADAKGIAEGVLGLSRSGASARTPRPGVEQLHEVRGADKSSAPSSKSVVEATLAPQLNEADGPGDDLLKVFRAAKAIAGNPAAMVKSGLEAKLKRLSAGLRGQYKAALPAVLKVAKAGGTWEEARKAMPGVKLGEGLVEAQEAEFIAKYNGKTIEFKAASLYAAKLHAIKELKVPKSKQGLLALMNKKSYDKGDFRYESLDEAAGKGVVRITVKKRQDVWAAVYHIDGKAQEGPTYYTGGLDREDKQEAISTAKAMRAEAKKAGYTVQESDELVEKVTKQQHARNMEKAMAAQGTSTRRAINPNEYPPIKGLEGPFQFKNGNVLYYDPREGSYYDSKSDIYVSPPRESVDEAKRPSEETLSFSDQVDANSAHKKGQHIQLTAALYQWATKRFGKGNGVSITNQADALRHQKIHIHKPVGRMGTKQITITPFGPYLQVFDNNGGGMSVTPDKKFFKVYESVDESIDQEWRDFARKLGKDLRGKEKPNAKKMQAKGYQFVIFFTDDYSPEPLYAKTKPAADKIARDYKDKKTFIMPIDKLLAESVDEDEKDNARKMKAKGYRFIIVFPGNKPEPLYAKTLSMATELIKDHGAPKGVKGQPIDSFLNENDDKTDDLPAKAEAGLKAKAKEMGATSVTGKGPSVNATFKDQKKAEAFLKHAKTVGKAAMRRSGDTEFTVHIDETFASVETHIDEASGVVLDVQKSSHGTPTYRMKVSGKAGKFEVKGEVRQHRFDLGSEITLSLAKDLTTVNKAEGGHLPPGAYGKVHQAVFAKLKELAAKHEDDNAKPATFIPEGSLPESCVEIGDGRVYHGGEMYGSVDTFLVSEAGVSITAGPDMSGKPAQEMAAMGQAIKKAIDLPVVNPSVMTLGGPDRPTLFITLGWEPRETWAGNIFENSVYAKISLDSDGTMEMSVRPWKRGMKLPFLRKGKYKNTADAIRKIKAMVEKVKKALADASEGDLGEASAEAKAELDRDAKRAKMKKDGHNPGYSVSKDQSDGSTRTGRVTVSPRGGFLAILTVNSNTKVAGNIASQRSRFESAAFAIGATTKFVSMGKGMSAALKGGIAESGEVEEGLISVKVTASNGDYWTTAINGPFSAAKAYFMGNQFNVGHGGRDIMVTIKKVELVEDEIDEENRTTFAELEVGKRFAKVGMSVVYEKTSKNAAKLIKATTGMPGGSPSRQKPHEVVIRMGPKATYYGGLGAMHQAAVNIPEAVGGGADAISVQVTDIFDNGEWQHPRYTVNVETNNRDCYHFGMFEEGTEPDGSQTHAKWPCFTNPLKGSARRGGDQTAVDIKSLPAALQAQLKSLMRDATEWADELEFDESIVDLEEYERWAPGLHEAMQASKVSARQAAQRGEVLVIGSGGLRRQTGISVFPNSVYYMGASTSPEMVVVTAVSGDNITYSTYPHAKTTTGNLRYLMGLIADGTRMRMKQYAAYTDAKQKDTWKKNLAGEKGPLNGKQKLRDYQYILVTCVANAKTKDMYGQTKSYGVLYEYWPANDSRAIDGKDTTIIKCSRLAAADMKAKGDFDVVKVGRKVMESTQDFDDWLMENDLDEMMSSGAIPAFNHPWIGAYQSEVELVLAEPEEIEDDLAEGVYTDEHGNIESIDEGSIRLERKPSSSAREVMMIVMQDGKPIGFIRKFNDTRTDKFPWQAMRYKGAFKGDGTDQYDFLGSTYVGGKQGPKIATNAVVTGKKLSESFDADYVEHVSALGALLCDEAYGDCENARAAGNTHVVLCGPAQRPTYCPSEGEAERLASATSGAQVMTIDDYEQTLVAMESICAPLDEAIPPTVEGFRTYLVGALTQHDQKEMVKSMKRGYGHNANALGLYLQAIDRMFKDPKMRGVKKTSTSKEDLAKLAAAIRDYFNMPPSNKTAKAIDKFLETGKAPNYPGSSRKRTKKEPLSEAYEFIWEHADLCHAEDLDEAMDAYGLLMSADTKLVSLLVAGVKKVKTAIKSAQDGQRQMEKRAGVGKTTGKDQLGPIIRELEAYAATVSNVIKQAQTAESIDEDELDEGFGLHTNTKVTHKDRDGEHEVPAQKLTKATLYLPGGAGAWKKHEVREITLFDAPYAQHKHALHLRWMPKGARKMRGVVLSYQPRLVVIPGHNIDLEPESLFGAETISKVDLGGGRTGTVATAKGRRMSTDKGWDTSMRARVDAYTKQGGHKPAIAIFESEEGDIEILEADDCTAVEEKAASLHDQMVTLFSSNGGTSYTVEAIARLFTVSKTEAMKMLSRLVTEGTLSFKRGEGYSLKGGKGLKREGMGTHKPGSNLKSIASRISDRRTYNYESDEEGEGEELDETTTSGGVGGFARAPIGGHPKNKGREGGIRDDGKHIKGAKANFTPGAIGKVVEQMREAMPQHAEEPDEFFIAMLGETDERVAKVVEIFPRKQGGPWVVADPYGNEIEHESKEAAVGAGKALAETENWGFVVNSGKVADESDDMTDDDADTALDEMMGLYRPSPDELKKLPKLKIGKSTMYVSDVSRHGHGKNGSIMAMLYGARGGSKVMHIYPNGRFTTEAFGAASSGPKWGDTKDIPGLKAILSGARLKMEDIDEADVATGMDNKRPVQLGRIERELLKVIRKERGKHGIEELITMSTLLQSVPYEIVNVAAQNLATLGLVGGNGRGIILPFGESSWGRFENHLLEGGGLNEAEVEIYSRYEALGIPMPDPKTMCQGQCEGTGVVPTGPPEGYVKEGKAFDPSDNEEPWRSLWLEAEEQEPSDDGWHFVKCPECKGSGKCNEAVLDEASIKTGNPEVPEIGFARGTYYYVGKSGAKNSVAIPPAKRKDKTFAETKFRQMLSNEAGGGMGQATASKLIDKLKSQMSESLDEAITAKTLKPGRFYGIVTSKGGDASDPDFVLFVTGTQANGTAKGVQYDVSRNKSAKASFNGVNFSGAKELDRKDVDGTAKANISRKLDGKSFEDFTESEEEPAQAPAFEETEIIEFPESLLETYVLAAQAVQLDDDPRFVYEDGVITAEVPATLAPRIRELVGSAR